MCECAMHDLLPINHNKQINPSSCYISAQSRFDLFGTRGKKTEFIYQNVDFEQNAVSIVI